MMKILEVEIKPVDYTDNGMKVITLIIFVGLLIGYINFMSPEKRMKRKEKIDAFTMFLELASSVVIRLNN